jgi:branched-chain amino acid transport system ATP-binding protein
MTTSMLTVEGLQTSYGQSQVLFGVDLEVRRGEVVTLLGRNGMGKTTTIRSIMGMTPPHGGTITFEGRELRGLTSFRIAKLGLGLVPEGRCIFPSLTVWENLTATSAAGPSGQPRWTTDAIVELFPWIRARKHQMGGQLSGGEQQMVAIGRALMSKPKILLMDEPSAGLAPLVVDQVFDLVGRIRAEGFTVLIVEQNVSQVLAVVDRAYLLEVGRIRLAGSAAELRDNALIRQSYMGL